MLTVARLDDHAVFCGGMTFGVIAVGNVFDKVDIVYLTRELGDDDVVEGVPLAHYVARFELGAVVEIELRAVRYLRAHQLEAGVVVVDTHFGKTTDYNFVALAGLDGADFLKLELAVVFRHKLVGCRGVGCHTTDVECTEGKLCTGLADRLSRDHTDSLAHLHHAVSSEVTAITLGTHSALGLTGEH